MAFRTVRADAMASRRFRLNSIMRRTLPAVRRRLLYAKAPCPDDRIGRRRAERAADIDRPTLDP